MSKRSYLRKGAASLAALALGSLGSEVSAQIVLPPDLTIGIQTLTPGLLEGRVAGSFNTTDPNPGQVGTIGGIQLEPIRAQVVGNGNVEPFPDNTTYIYSGQMFFPDNAGGTSRFAFAEHFDDSTLIRIDGVERLSNTVWDIPNTTGVLELSPGWHDVEFRFGEGTGGWGPSANNGWDDTLGFGVDFTVPVAGDTTQANYTRPVDPGTGTGTVFRVPTYNTDTSRDGQSVTVNANAKLTVFQARTVPLGALTVANGVTFTAESPGGTTSFTEANLGSTATFAVASGTVSIGPLKSAGPVTSVTKTGPGTLLMATGVGSTVPSTTVNVNAGTLAVAIGTTGAAAVGTGPINLNGSTLALTNDVTAPNRGGVFQTTGQFYADDPFDPIIAQDSANTFGWSGLDSKTNLDTKLLTRPILATRPVNLEINFPRGSGSLVDGGTNDDITQLFNVDGANLGVPLADDTFVARFNGKLNVTSAGATEFLLMSNDGAVLFIDMDTGAGVNWQKVADNNRFALTGGTPFQGHYSGSSQGVTDPNLTVDPLAPAIANPAAPNLAVGVYDYIVGYFNQLGGEAGVELYWTPAGGTRSIVPYAITTGPVTLSNTVTVSGNSTIDVQAPTATLTNLTMTPGSSLTAKGNQLTTGITATGAGTVSIGTANRPVIVTSLNDGGNAVTFLAGPGEVNIFNPSGAGVGATSSVGVGPGGLLVAMNLGATGSTLGGSAVTLAGGTLQLRVSGVPAAGATLTAGLLEGRLAGAFNTTAPNPGTSPNPAVGGIKLEPILAQTPGSGNVEPIPDNTTHIYTGQYLVPDNGVAGDGIGHVAFAEHFDDNTLLKIDGVTLINNQNWDIPNTTGPLTLPAGWHDIEMRFGEGGGGWGPSNSGGWNDTLGFGVDTTLPIEGNTVQGNYVRPVDNGSMNTFRVVTGSFVTPNFQSNVTATENSTIQVAGAAGAQIGSVTVADGKTLTVTGNLTVGGSLNGAGTLAAPANTTIDFTLNGPAASGSPKLSLARGATTNFAPGAAGTFAASAVSTIANEGLLHAANGVTDLSGATMTTANVPGLMAGVLGGRVPGSPNPTDFPSVANSAIDLGMSRANTTDVGFFGGNGGTWVYTGEIKIPDTDGDGTPGPIAFGEQFDDYALLKIDGATLINNNAWNTAGSSGEIERADNEPDGIGTAGDGWFSIEARFGDSGGGIGANTGWDIGFGIDTNPADGFDTGSSADPPTPVATRAQYVVLPADNGTMNLFRAVNPALENVRVDAGATLKVGALVGANVVNVNGNGRLEIHGPTTSKITSALNIAGATGAWTGTVDLTDADLALQSSTATKTADFNRTYDQLKSGFAGGVWTGTGITSSTAATNPAADTGLSLVDNALLGATDFGGQPVNGDSLLLKYTYYGDIDMNGQVDGDDLTTFALNFGRTSGATQVDGDIDFNGRVDGEDLTVFANNFNKGVGNPLAAGAVAAVPEPSTILLAGLGAAGLAAAGVARRRRRS